MTAYMAGGFPYKLSNKEQIIRRINELASLHTPFLFIIDYKAAHGYVMQQSEMDEDFVRFATHESIPPIQSLPRNITWLVESVTMETYRPKFDYVKDQIHKGNSFLTNLTQPSFVHTNVTLRDLFDFAPARYKLWLKDMFTVFSPETFVKIEGRTISSFPMKGTIDASIPNAAEKILNDEKEKAEHATIVDLIRNDLSLVASEVEVKQYRYINRLKTNKKDLLQVSSEITGLLPENYYGQLGDILFSLLPAGSISGAPKQKTLEIISRAEGYNRGFYTGICGFFDGYNLDSGVMIRFVEQVGDKLVFKSGGGITSRSVMEKEYEELIQKIYVPVY